MTTLPDDNPLDNPALGSVPAPTPQQRARPQNSPITPEVDELLDDAIDQAKIDRSIQAEANDNITLPEF